MAITNDKQSQSSSAANRSASGASLAAAADGSPTGTADQSARQYPHPGPTSPAPRAPPESPVAGPRAHRWRKRLLLAAGAVGILAVGGYLLVPWVDTALNTVSTDDAYVNGHVTFVAPRVSGQVAKVLVDDNHRVRKGDVLVQLDPEPYDVQVNVAKAAVDAARADLGAARAQTRGLAGQVSSLYFALQHAIEDVDDGLPRRLLALRRRVDCAGRPGAGDEAFSGRKGRARCRALNAFA